MEQTAADLMNFLQANPPASTFTPYCRFSSEADALTVYFKGDADYSERLNDHMTLYRSLETHEIIGCRVKGISSIIEDLPNYVSVHRTGIELSVVFLPFRGIADDRTRDAVNAIAKEASRRKMVIEPSASV